MGELPLGDEAFATPVPGNMGDIERAKVRALDLTMDAHAALVDRFTADFSVDAGGFPQFGDIEDPLTRAVATGRVRAACESAGRNLVEMRLHEHGVHSAIGPNGLAWPGHDKSVDAAVNRDFLGLHVTGVFRAAASVLDCWSAVLIGVIRLPVSLAKASATDVVTVTSKLGKLTKALPRVAPQQQELWRSPEFEWTAAAASAGPDGWLDWTNHMRNALVHRGRGLTILTNRPTAELIVPDYYRERPHEFVRYDPLLARRPWVQHIQDMVEQGPLGPYLAEPAQVTLTLLRKHPQRVLGDGGDVGAERVGRPAATRPDIPLSEVDGDLRRAGLRWFHRRRYDDGNARHHGTGRSGGLPVGKQALRCSQRLRATAFTSDRCAGVRASAASSSVNDVWRVATRGCARAG
jgi:hypothetical protein